MAKALLRSEFLKFLLTGGVAAFVNLAARWLLDLVMGYEIAVVFAYLAGMTTAYTLTRLFVFEASGRSVKDEFTRFSLVNLVALAQVWLVSVGLARLAFPAIGFEWHADDVAHFIGVAVPAVTSYFGHRHFSFAQKPDLSDEDKS